MTINPVSFTNNDNAYQHFKKKYKTHDNGLFILAPSGSGKTYFCDHQAEPHWIDGDALWMATNAHPEGAWWLEPVEVINRIDQRSDVITMEAKTQGFWILGASNYWLKPDAIVIPKWDTHKAYIAEREANHYDGGATTENFDQVLGHIEVIKKWHTDHGVPMFDSVAEAVASITKS